MDELDELDLVNRWIDMKQHNQGCSKYTVYVYRLHLVRLKAYLEAHAGQTLLTATPEAIESYTGRYLHEQKVRPISRTVPVAAIRGFYAWAVQKKVLDDSPAQALPSPHAGRRLPRAMSLAHAEKLLMQPGLETFIACRDTAMLAVLIGSGCRVSGLCHLTEEDLFWTQSTTGTERLVIRLTEKGKKERLVPVQAEVGLLIRAYLGHPDLALVDRVLPNGKRVLFISTSNHTIPADRYYGIHRQLSPITIQRMIERYGRECGIAREYCRPHALRHLYGTELAEEEVDLLVRQALLGHSQPDTTEVYTHLATRKLATIVDKAAPLAKMKNTPARALWLRLQRTGQA